MQKSPSQNVVILINSLYRIKNVFGDIYFEQGFQQSCKLTVSIRSKFTVGEASLIPDCEVVTKH